MEEKQLKINIDKIYHAGLLNNFVDLKLKMVLMKLDNIEDKNINHFLLGGEDVTFNILQLLDFMKHYREIDHEMVKARILELAMNEGEIEFV